MRALAKRPRDFDFLVKTPEADDNDLCGVVSYDDFEVRIYGDRYEFWDDGVYVTPDYTVSTAGFHNIGIQASGSTNSADGVYIDGTHVLGYNVPFNNTTPPLGGFGSLQPASSASGANGCELLDYFSYIKALNRVEEAGDDVDGDGDDGGYEVSFYDYWEEVTTYRLRRDPNPAYITTGEPTGSSAVINGLPRKDVLTDATQVSFGNLGGYGTADPYTRDQLDFALTARGSVGCVNGNDAYLQNGGDAELGQRFVVLTAANGSSQAYARIDASTTAVPDTYTGGTGATANTIPAAPIYATTEIPTFPPGVDFCGCGTVAPLGDRVWTEEEKKKVDEITEEYNTNCQPAPGGYREGRSGHGAPVRRIRRTASRIGLGTVAGRPLPSARRGLIGISGSMRAYCAFVRSIPTVSAPSNPQL